MMQITCKCLNVMIYSKGSIIDNYDFKFNGTNANHPFFKENIGCIELERIHKEQALLVVTENVGEWVIHNCLNCGLYSHALNTSSNAIVLVNRAMLTKPQEISALKNSNKFSPVFRIIIDHKKEDDNALVSGVRMVSAPGAALQQQLSEWLKHEASQTEDRVRQYSEQQYAALESLRAQAHRDHHALSRLLSEASVAQKCVPQMIVGATPQPSAMLRPQPEMPDQAVTKKTVQATNRPRNLARKPSVDAEGLFDLEGMDDTVEAFPSDEELSDTDESGSHDEGIHIPRHMGSAVYAKSLPVNVPTFMQHLGSDDSLHRTDHRAPQDPMDIAASIKALAKSVHGDAVFGDLPRPRFSSQI